MKNSTIYILGHKNPDTDSICSSIAYAHLKEKMGYKKVIPGRLGNINKETEFILKHFNISAPQLIDHVRAQVSDIDYYVVPPVHEDISLREAWKIMMDSNRRMLPVVDKVNSTMIGVVSLGDITRINMQIENCENLSKYSPTINNIVTTLKAYALCGNINKFKDNIVTGKVLVIMNAEDIENHVITEDDILIVRGSEECIVAALETKSKYILVVEKYKEHWELDLSQIKKNGVLLFTEYDVCAALKLLIQSIPVSAIMKKENIISFNESDFCEDVKKIMLESRIRNYPVLDDDNRVVGVISRRHVLDVDKKKVILLDHNEWSQAVFGLDEAEVLEIIDHHRVGDIQTGNPILFRNQPVGSTCTIIANMYFEHDIKPSKSIAGILLSGIISDTLLFKSPTCTVVDKMTTEKLSIIADVNIEEFGLMVLRSGASLEGRTVEEILNTDYKEFGLPSGKIFVSQAFTTDLNEAYTIKDDMLNLMNEICQKVGCQYGLVMITDILGSGTELIYTSEARRIIERVFGATPKSNISFLPKVVSRKKEIIPMLSK